MQGEDATGGAKSATTWETLLKKLIHPFFPWRLRWRTVRISLAGTTTDYNAHKEQARVFVRQRLSELNQAYEFTYHRVSVKNQHTRWGSCSQKGNLNFHYKIIFLHPALADYLLVHELCHLSELNHSPRFWELVSKTISNYQQMRKELRKTHLPES